MFSLASMSSPQRIWSLSSWVIYSLFRSLLWSQWNQSFFQLPQLEKVEMPHYWYIFDYLDYASCWLTQSTLKEIDRLTHLQVLNISNSLMMQAIQSSKPLATILNLSRSSKPSFVPTAISAMSKSEPLDSRESFKSCRSVEQLKMERQKTLTLESLSTCFPN